MENKLTTLYVEVTPSDSMVKIIALFYEMIDTLPDYQVLEKQKYTERFWDLLDTVLTTKAK